MFRNPPHEPAAGSGQLLDESLIAKIRGIQIRARHMVNDVFAGEYQSAFKGRGLEFEEVREYQPGDDVRSIDWNVTARVGTPFIKLYKDERELTVIFLVDVSGSSRFGTVRKFKNEVAAEITALLAYTALKNNDQVGLIIFSHGVEHYLPPKKGRSHVWTLIRDILNYDSQSKQTNLEVPLEFLNLVVKKRAIVFLVSDFQIEGYEKMLRLTAKHHDLIAISIKDPREEDLPRVGFIELEDAETGENILIDTYRSQTLRDHKLASRADELKQIDFFRSAGIDHIPVKTNESYVDTIARFFRKREQSR